MKRKFRKVIYWLADPLIWMAAFIFFPVSYWRRPTQ